MKTEVIFFRALEECLGRGSVLCKDSDIRQYLGRHGARLMSDHAEGRSEQRESNALAEILGLLLGAEEPGGGPMDGAEPQAVTNAVRAVLRS